jgi:hypothetical protein
MQFSSLMLGAEAIISLGPSRICGEESVTV